MALFAVLIQHQSFTAAAHALGVSVSHVSKQLAALEASLGVKLVQRTTRSFTLTDAGNLFYAQCRELLTIVTNAQSEMEDQRDEVVGLIRLGLSQSFGTLHVLPALEQLRQQYPELNVEVHLFDHKVDMLKEGLDLWITSNEQLPEGYVAQRIADCRFVVAASPDYLLRYGSPTEPMALMEHNCLIYRSWERDYTVGHSAEMDTIKPLKWPETTRSIWRRRYAMLPWQDGESLIWRPICCEMNFAQGSLFSCCRSGPPINRCRFMRCIPVVNICRKKHRR